jgi:hypothetical protein
VHWLETKYCAWQIVQTVWPPAVWLSDSSMPLISCSAAVIRASVAYRLVSGSAETQIERVMSNSCPFSA